MSASLGTTKTGTAFTSRGNHVNDSVGKTEALIIFYGTGAATARADLNAGSQTITAVSPIFRRLELESQNGIITCGL